MKRKGKVRQPRGNAATGPDAKPCAPAGSRIHDSTAESSRPADALTDAQVLVGSTAWLLSLADWLAEELDLADGETVRLRLLDVEKMRVGLTRCVACLDTLTVDPAELPPVDEDPSETAQSPATLSPRVLQ